MNAEGITPRLAVALRSLAESQLQAQAARSIALDAGAIGVMALDTAAAAFYVAARLDDGFWTACLGLIGLSFVLALRIVLTDGAKEIGPSVSSILEDRGCYVDDELEQWPLEDMAVEVLANESVLTGKVPQLTGALTFAALATLLGLVGLVS